MNLRSFLILLRPVICAALFFVLEKISAQIPKEVDEKFYQLNADYQKGHLTGKQYLHKIDSFTYYLISEGIKLSNEELIKKLETFQKIAWKGDKYASSRIAYYKILKANAQMSGRGGVAIFFAEKMDTEIQKQGGWPTLSETYQRCYFYIINGNYQKATEIYENAIDRIESYPELIKNKKISNFEIFDLLGLNALIISAHIKASDTFRVQRCVDISEAVVKAHLPQVEGNLYRQLYSKIMLLMLYRDQAYFLKDFGKAEENALEILDIITKNEKVLGNFSDFVRVNSLESLIDIYLTTQDFKKAEYYIREYENGPDQLIDQSYLTEHFKSDLYAGQGKYREAYELLSKALSNKDKVYATLANEMDELLYAHTEAEFNRIALEKVERAKRNRLIIIIVISAIAVAIITATYLLMRRRESEAQTRILKLNDMVNMQIAILEEVKYQATREEQQRLGKELHDGLAASIAGIKHQVELAGIDSNNEEQKKQLSGITQQLDNTYHQIRQKSHDWYNNSDKSLEQSFERRIRELIDSALPNNHYHKIVEIDDDVLHHINLNTRIELLRIIQEAIVNIIKHTKAKTISMLMYEENESLILTIKDDGKGFEAKTASKKHLGITSISNRVTKMSGTLDIISDSKGTELIVSIPVNKTEPI